MSKFLGTRTVSSTWLTRQIQAEAAPLICLKAEVAAGPPSRQNPGEDDAIQGDQVQVHAAQGLEGVLQELRRTGGQARGVGDDEIRDEEYYIKKYLTSELETVACLKFWERQEKEFGNHKIKGALCQLAR